MKNDFKDKTQTEMRLDYERDYKVHHNPHILQGYTLILVFVALLAFLIFYLFRFVSADKAQSKTFYRFSIFLCCFCERPKTTTVVYENKTIVIESLV